MNGTDFRAPVALVPLPFEVAVTCSSDVDAPVMGPFESSHQHGPPLLGRVRAPSRSPASPLVCSPPTPLLSSASAPVVPRLRPTSVRTLLLCPSRGRQPVRSRTRCASERIYRISVAPDFSEEGQGPPRLLGRPLRACRGRRPRRVRALLAHGGESAVAFRQSNALGTRNVIGFVAAWPTAHALACLRINAPVARIAARLATGPGGLTPDRAGFAPAGQQTGFHEVIASLIPPRPAWPGRNWSSYPHRSKRY